MFGGGREVNSHPQGIDGEESCNIHILTIRDGSCHGLRQLASQGGLVQIRMENSDVGWIFWVEGRGVGGSVATFCCCWPPSLVTL